MLEPLTLPVADSVPRDRWRRLCDLADTLPWRDAVREALGQEALDRQTYHLGSDLLHGLPWGRLTTALEIGSGLGFVTNQLASLAQQVVAVDWLPERADFLKRRLPQDSVRSVVASPLDLPFAPASFDVVVVNDLPDDAKNERRLFTDAFRLLRPGGLFYFVTACSSSLAFLGRSKPSARQYETILRQTGFDGVEAFGAFPDCRRQKATYPLGSRQARSMVGDMVDPPSTAFGAIRRFAVHCLPCSAVDSEVIFLAGKNVRERSLLWPDLAAKGPVAQFNTSTKVSLIDCATARPGRLTRVAKDAASVARLTREHDFLTTADPLLQPGSLRLPRALGKDAGSGRELFHFEFIAGTTLSQQLLPRVYSERRLLPLVTGLVDGYVDLVRRLTAAWPQASEPPWWRILADVNLDDLGMSRQLAAACDRARNWPTQVMHGDLTLNNTLLDTHGRLVLVDWENVSLAGLAAIDLFRLLFDAWQEQTVYSPWVGPNFLAHVQRVVRTGLGRLGFEPASYADLQVLFLAHQVQFDRTRDCDDAMLRRALREGGLDLTR